MKKSLFDLKNEMIELMTDVHGNRYTLGWIKTAYLIPVYDEERERFIIMKTIAELKDQQAANMLAYAESRMKK